jgi:hypothetical protein
MVFRIYSTGYTKMTKKKSSIWLHRPKRRSLPRHNFFSQLCRKLPPEILNDLYESSQQSVRKHKTLNIHKVLIVFHRLLRDNRIAIEICTTTVTDKTSTTTTE